MSPKLKNLSGKEVINFLLRSGFVFKRQRGSHIVLVGSFEDIEVIAIVPAHKSISVGTLKSLYRQAKRCLPDNIVNDFFYSK